MNPGARACGVGINMRVEARSVSLWTCRTEKYMNHAQCTKCEVLCTSPRHMYCTSAVNMKAAINLELGAATKLLQLPDAKTHAFCL